MIFVGRAGLPAERTTHAERRGPATPVPPSTTSRNMREHLERHGFATARAGVDRLCEHFFALSVDARDISARGSTSWPPPGKMVYAAVRSSGVTSPVPSASDGTSGRPFSPASDASRSTARDPTRCCRSTAAALFDSSSAARSVSASGCSPSALRGDPFGIARRGSRDRRFVQHRHRRKPVLERRRVDERLERRPGCRRPRVARLNVLRM